jgi:hypothetical protein
LQEELPYGITWSDECRAELVRLYNGDEKAADDAVRAIEFQLCRDPLGETYRLSAASDVRLVWIGPRMDYPAVTFSFRIVKERYRQNCVMERARRTNVLDRMS